MFLLMVFIFTVILFILSMDYDKLKEFVDKED